METSGWIWLNYKLIQALVYVIITCKYDKDPIKNSREKVETSFFPLLAYGDFFRRSRAAKSAVGGPMRPKFELVQALMHVIITCKYEMERIKTGEKKWRHRFPHNPICYHGNQRLDLAEFQTHPSSHVCYHYLQVWKASDQEKPRKSGDIVFPIISLWGYLQMLKGS